VVYIGGVRRSTRKTSVRDGLPSEMTETRIDLHRSAGSSSPVVALLAITDEARAALAGRSEVRINAFPCTVGRESRSKPRADSVLTKLRLGRAPHEMSCI